MKSWMKYGLYGILAGIIINVLFIALGLSGLIPSAYLTNFINNQFFRSAVQIVSIFSVTSALLFVLTIVEIAVYWFLIGIIFGKLNEKIKKSVKKRVYWIFLVVLGLGVLALILTSLRFTEIVSVPNMTAGTQNTIDNLYQNISLVNSEGGACVIADSATGYKLCTMTSNETCSGTFNKGLLCTAEQLATACGPSLNHKSIGDGEYFIDTCGNQANPYDASQVNNESYWTSLIR